MFTYFTADIAERWEGLDADEQAAEMRAGAQERAEAIVDGEAPFRGGKGHHGHRGGQNGPGGAVTPDVTPAVPETPEADDAEPLQL